MKTPIACLAIALLLNPAFGNAQPLTRPLQILADVSFDLGGSDELRGMVQTQDGHLLMGYSEVASGLGFTIRPWMIRLNEAGEKLWHRTSTELPWREIVAFGASSDRSVFVANSGFQVSKMDFEGSVIWKQGVGLGFQPSVVGDDDGGCLVAGVVNMGVDRGFDIRVVALDKSGSLRWERYWGGSGDELGPRIAITTDRQILLTAWSSSLTNGNVTSNGAGGWLVSMDFAGETRWQKVVGAGSVYTIEADSTGGCWTGSGAHFLPDGSPATNGLGSENWVVTRFDSSGEKLWEQTFGGLGQDRPSAMLRQDEDQLIVAGFSGSPVSGNRLARHFGGFDFWCVKLDTNGQMMWQTAHGGSREDTPSCLVAAKDGGFILGGRSNSKPSGNKQSPTISPYDVWLLHIAPDSVPSPSEGLGLWPLEEFSPRRILSASGPAGTTFVLEKSDYLETWHPVSTNVFGTFDSKLELPSDTAQSEYYRLVAD